MSLLFILYMCSVIMQCVGRFNNQQECSYQFNVWQADADQIQRMKNLESQFANFSNYVDKELFRFRYERSSEVGHWVNSTLSSERSLGELQKLQLQRYSEMQDMKFKFEQFETKLKDLESKLLPDVVGRKKHHVRKDRMVPNHAQADTPRHHALENLRGMVSNLKAEWILIKRDVIQMRHDNDEIKKEHSQIANKTDTLRSQSDEFANTLSSFKTKESAYEGDIMRLRGTVEQNKQDLLTMKYGQEQLRSNVLKQGNDFVSLQATCIDSRRRLEEIQTTLGTPGLRPSSLDTRGTSNIAEHADAQRPSSQHIVLSAPEVAQNARTGLPRGMH